jgi:hypothetical protein
LSRTGRTLGPIPLHFIAGCSQNLIPGIEKLTLPGSSGSGNAPAKLVIHTCGDQRFVIGRHEFGDWQAMDSEHCRPSKGRPSIAGIVSLVSKPNCKWGCWGEICTAGRETTDQRRILHQNGDRRSLISFAADRVRNSVQSGCTRHETQATSAVAPASIPFQRLSSNPAGHESSCQWVLDLVP